MAQCTNTLASPHWGCGSYTSNRDKVAGLVFYLLPEFVKQGEGQAAWGHPHAYIIRRARVPMPLVAFAILNKQHKNKVVLL